MTLDEWLGEQARQFRAADDKDRLGMIQCYVQGYEARERDPDFAIAAFSQGMRTAEQLGEPWWALFYQNERVEALLHFKRDYSDVLDLAMKNVLELRNPRNIDYPGRYGLWDCLLSAYLGIDAEGYAEPIQQAIDHLDEMVPAEPDGARYLLMARRRIFATERGDLKEVYEGCMKELELAGSDGDQDRAMHFATFTYCSLCQVASAVGDFETLKEWAGVGEELAQHVGHQCELGELLAWQAVAALSNGDPEQAHTIHRKAVTLMGRLKMPPKKGYFDALVHLHEANGDLEEALAVREAELAVIEGRGRLLYETRTRLQRCGLLARLGRLQQRDLAKTREAAAKLKEPEKYLAEIELLKSELQ